MVTVAFLASERADPLLALEGAYLPELALQRAGSPIFSIGAYNFSIFRLLWFFNQKWGGTSYFYTR